MICHGKTIDGVLYQYVNHGVRRVMIVDSPADKFYYRKEWVQDYNMAQKPGDYAEWLFVDLGHKYKSKDFYKWWESMLGGGPSNGPSSYTRQIPELQVRVRHPAAVNAGYESTLESVIISLNDTHGWSREQIADWLETLDVNPILNKSKEE